MTATLKKEFSNRPDYLIPNFEHHILNIGSLEEWSHISMTRPDISSLEVIIPIFTIPERFPMAPCPLCCPNSQKFRTGVLIWCKSTGLIHAIGNCCGRKFFGENFNKQLNISVRRQNRKAHEEFIERNWQLTNKYVDLSHQILPCVRDFDRIIRALKGGIGGFVLKDLKEAINDDGYLFERKILSNDYASPNTSSAIKIRFGETPIVGGQLFLPEHNKLLESRLKNPIGLLETIDWDNENEVIEYLYSESSNKLIELKDAITNSYTAFKEVKKAIKLLRSFLSQSNLDLINKWSQRVHTNENVKIFFKDNTLRVYRNNEKRKDIQLTEDRLEITFKLPKPKD